MTAWTSPREWNVGESLDTLNYETLWNTHHRDNFNHLREVASGVPCPVTFDLRMLESTTNTLVANACFYGRSRGVGTVDSIAFQVTTSIGNISVAVYSNTGSGRSAAPNSRLQTSGSVACPASGAADVALGGSVSVDASGNYWLAISSSGAPVLVGMNGSLAFDSNLAAGLGAREASAHPAPATASPSASSMRIPMLVGA